MALSHLYVTVGVEEEMKLGSSSPGTEPDDNDYGPVIRTLLRFR